MKQYNGSDYDNLLPLAYNALNSDLLNGNSYELIYNNILNNFGKVAVGLYLGTGTLSSINPTNIVFDFIPKFVIVYRIVGFWNGSYGYKVSYPSSTGNILTAEKIGMFYDYNQEILLIIPCFLLDETFKLIFRNKEYNSTTEVWAKFVNNTLSFYGAMRELYSYSGWNNMLMPSHIYWGIG